jgi:hypothetical protein
MTPDRMEEAIGQAGASTAAVELICEGILIALARATADPMRFLSEQHAFAIAKVSQLPSSTIAAAAMLTVIDQVFTSARATVEKR